MTIDEVKNFYSKIKPRTASSRIDTLVRIYQYNKENFSQFREKLYFGEDSFFRAINETQKTGIWVDFGGAAVLENLSDDQLNSYEKVYLVNNDKDTVQKLEEMIAGRQLTNVETANVDILNFQPAEFCDVVSFSYSLTMTPQWYKALDYAYKLLAPQGTIGVLDFYISEKHPIQGLKTHDPMTRNFWPLFFSYDNIFLNPDHLPYLLNKFEKVKLFESEGKIPYLPVGKVPYFSFIGKKDN